MPPTGGSGSRSRFRKHSRLRKRNEYLRVQRRGRRIHLQDVIALVLRRSAGQRVGITVSSRVGIAVKRNRIKRLLREAWRHDHGFLPDGVDIVFVAKRRAVELNLDELRKQLRELGRRLG